MAFASELVREYTVHQRDDARDYLFKRAIMGSVASSLSEDSFDPIAKDDTGIEGSDTVDIFRREQEKSGTYGELLLEIVKNCENLLIILTELDIS